MTVDSAYLPLGLEGPVCVSLLIEITECPRFLSSVC